MHEHFQKIEPATRVGFTSAGCHSPKWRRDMKTIALFAEFQLKHGFGDTISYALFHENELV